MSLDFDVFVVDPKPIPSAVPGFEEAVGPATWPPSTSTLISDERGALLVDCLITEQEGRELAAWVKSHHREPGYVYITHPHADHFLGLPEILAAFPQARPVALAESIPAMEEQISPGYMQVWSGFFPGQLTSKPVAPAPLAGTTVPVGGSAATVIPVGTTDTGHSSVVHVPGLSLVVSGDAVYNQTHMWLRGRHRTPAPAGRGRWMPWRRWRPTPSSPGTATHGPPTTTPAARSPNAAATSPISRRRWNAAPPRPSSSTR